MSDAPMLLCMSPHLPHHRVIAVDRETGLRAVSDMGMSLFRARMQALERLDDMIRRAPENVEEK